MIEETNIFSDEKLLQKEEQMRFFESARRRRKPLGTHVEIVQLKLKDVVVSEGCRAAKY